MAFAILRTAKLKTMGEIAGSLAHTYRTIPTSNADPKRTHLNEHQHIGAFAVKGAIAAVLPEKRRSDAVLCIEHLITASPEWDGWRTDKERDFFDRSLEWLKKTYGDKNVISTSIHRDETTPHMVAYVVPLKTCETRKGSGTYCQRLAAKDWLDGKDKLRKMQTSFAKKVEDLGLQRGLEGSKAEHQKVSDFYAKINNPTREIILKRWAEMDLPDSAFTESKKSYGARVLEQANGKFNSYVNEIEPKINQIYSAYQVKLLKEKELSRAERRARLRAEDALLKVECQVEDLKEKINKINELNDEKIAKIKEKYLDFDDFRRLYPSDGRDLGRMLHSKVWNHPESVAEREYQQDQERLYKEKTKAPIPKPEPMPIPKPEPMPIPKPEPMPIPKPEPMPKPMPEKPKPKRDDSLDFGM